MILRKLRRLGTWKEWLADGVGAAVLLTFIFIVVLVAGLAQSIYESDHAHQPRQIAKVCGAEGGICQW